MINWEEKITNLLQDNPSLRDNDRMLIARCIKEEYKTTDLFDIALNSDIKGNIYETIRRIRCKVQERNPNLRGSDYVRQCRAIKEEQYRQEMSEF